MELTASDIIFYSFCGSTLILILYYLIIFRKLAFYKPKDYQEGADKKPVSVIVCAKDEDRNLAKNIPGLIFQQYEGAHQLLIVNDNSEDDTRYILEELNRSFQKLTLLHLEQIAIHIPGKKYPLSVGIRESKNDILLLTDADCVPASEFWIDKMMSPYSNPQTEIVLGYGSYYKMPGFLNKLIRFETFHTAFQYLSYALSGLTYMGVGRNLSYTKDLFFKNKGFASINKIPGGDDDLFINKVAKRKNVAIVIDKDAHTLSTPKKTWKQWKQQKTRHYSTSKYYKTKHKFLLGLYSLVQFLFYPLLISSFFFFDWRMVLAVFLLKSSIQLMIMSKSMKKLNETDLIPWIFIMDVWMFFYYLLFAPKLWKKADKGW